ncbi:MAG: PrsW family glutamic-type intramembrane protease [Defluviitaleaceae bacterium]|nr:PrsW family glutamic-type intramembrane protease [Defluviitaleaceae bacterium]
MPKLFALGLAPTIICLIYMYIRDKYEKEPLRLLILGVVYGALITAPIVQAENFVVTFIPNWGVLMEAFYSSFAVAAFVEELFKWLVLIFLVWMNPEFNERVDGIVYAVFVSLGFAGLENILYVFNPTMGGLETALSRAIFSVPGHALFGVAMGYYFAIAKYEPQKRGLWLFMSFFMPFILHGTYNFILLSGAPYLMIVFVPFVAYLWVSGFKKIRAHLAESPFKRVKA